MAGSRSAADGARPMPSLRAAGKFEPSNLISIPCRRFCVRMLLGIRQAPEHYVALSIHAQDGPHAHLRDESSPLVGTSGFGIADTWRMRRHRS